MKRIICDDDDDDDDVEVNGARTPKDVTNSSLNKAANKFKRTPIEVSPGWLDARNPNILDEVERNMNIRVAKEERVIPKKKREVPKMVSNTPSTSSFTSSSSSSPSFLESPLDFNERRKQDLLNLQKKPVVSLLKKELGNTLLDRDRSFFKSKEERMKQEDRGTRLVRRASIPPKENTVKPDKAGNKVMDLVDIHSEDEEEEMENDDEAQMERENLTQADIRAQAQRIFKTCEDFSANLCKAIRAWRGKRGAESENGEASCVELTAINTSSQSGVKLLSEDDIRDFCPDLVLKAYQLVGINWLKLLHENHVNGVLADDMGLGKTVQTIAFLGYLQSQQSNLPHLVVVPASTLANWEDELERFCPSLNVYTYHGSQKERSSMRSELRSGVNEVDVLLTTYTIFERESGADDRKFLQNQSFDYLVLDEAHSIKNSASSRFIQLNRMRTRHRLLISGTPVQNDLQELLSLLSFLMPKVFRSSDCEILLEAFGNNNSNKSDKFGSSASSTLSLGKMKSVLAPFVLRRLKKDVLSQLVEKQVVDVKLAMTPFQRTVYAGIITSYACRKEKQKLDFESKEADFEGVNLHNIVATDRSSAAQKKEVINLLSPSTSSSSIDGGQTAPIEADQFLKRDLSQSEANHLFTALRKAANHPLLLRVHFSDPEVMSRIAQIAFQSEHYGSQCTLKMVREELESLSDFDLNQICIEHKHYLGEYILDSAVLYDSCKMIWLRDKLHELMREGHRMLIFSQWTKILDLLEVLLDDISIPFLRLDGSTPIAERQQLINRFNNESIPVFLLSTKAGGLGINLTAADVVIMHDLDFNPENDRQAEDRCHRIGQTKPVFVYKLVAEDSVDEDILNMGDRKRLLSETVLGSRGEGAARKGGQEGGDDAKGEIAQILLRALQKHMQS